MLSRRIKRVSKPNANMFNRGYTKYTVNQADNFSKAFKNNPALGPKKIRHRKFHR